MSHGLLDDRVWGKVFVATCDAGCDDYLRVIPEQNKEANEIEVVPERDWDVSFYFCYNFKFGHSIWERIKYIFQEKSREGEVLLSPEDTKALVKFLTTVKKK